MEQRTTPHEPTIQETPASMTEKMELLEDRVRETIEGTGSAVEHIVDNVKGTVEETISVMKDTVDEAKSTVGNLVENAKGTMDSTMTGIRQSFDLQYQVAHRPWVTFGGAVLAGYFVGTWTHQGSRRQRLYGDQEHQYDDDDNLYAAAVMSGGATVEDLDERKNHQKDGYAYPPHLSSTAQKHPRDTAKEQTSRQRQIKIMGGRFQEEWNILRDVALGTLMGTIRSMVRQQMPTFAPHVEKILNRTSAKLGTEPIDPIQSSPAHETGYAAENSAAKTLPTEGTQEPTSAIRGTPTESPSITAQPLSHTQYRR